MTKHQINLRDGIDLVKSKRPIACPNPGFMLQLKVFEKGIFGKNSDIGIILE